MGSFINLDIMKNPMNWIIVLAMTLLGFVMLEIFRQMWNNAPAQQAD